MSVWTKLQNDQTGYVATFPGTSVSITVRGENFSKGYPESSDRLPLLEGEFYWFEVTGGKISEKSSFVSRAAASGRLAPGTAVGFGVLYAKGHELSMNGLTIEVVSTVISYDSDFHTLLEDLTGRIADLQMQHSSDIALWVKNDPAKRSEHNVQRLFFLLGLIKNEAFDVAVRHVVEQPVMRLVDREDRQDVRRATRFSRNALVQFASARRRIYLPESHPLCVQMESVPEHITSFLREETADVPENRFVKFALGYFRSELRKYAKAINSGPNANISITVQLQEAAGLLDKWLGHSFFRGVGNLTTFPSASMVLQRREGYREILRKWVQYQMGAMLEWDGGAEIYKANQRNMAALYEYWCCLKLFDVVKSLFNFKDNDLFKSLAQEKGLVFGLKEGRSFSVEGTFEREGVKNELRYRKLAVTFSYNRTFSPPYGSWSLAMRPDYTLSFRPITMDEIAAANLDLVTYVHFDAKYKAKSLKAMLEDDDEKQQGNDDAEMQRDVKRVDLLKMHSYRDAIRRTGGAYVLYPGTVEGDHNDRNEYTEILPGLGAFPLSPSRDSSVNIRDFLRRIADHLCDRITQWENYTFERFRVFHSSTELCDNIPEEYDEKGMRQNAAALARAEKIRAEALSAENVAKITVYGTTHGADQSKWMKNTGWYPLPQEIAIEQGINTHDDAMRKKLLVIVAPLRQGKVPDVEVHSIVDVVPATAQQLKENYHYFKEPTHQNYLLFRVARKS